MDTSFAIAKYNIMMHNLRPLKFILNIFFNTDHLEIAWSYLYSHKDTWLSVLSRYSIQYSGKLSRIFTILVQITGIKSSGSTWTGSITAFCSLFRVSAESLSRPHHNHSTQTFSQRHSFVCKHSTHTQQLSEIDNGQSIQGAEWAACYTAHIATLLSDIKIEAHSPAFKHRVGPCKLATRQAALPRLLYFFRGYLRCDPRIFSTTQCGIPAEMMK